MGGTVEWLVPAAILAVLPKCPMCFVMYFAMVTGLGLSVPTAARFRTLIVLMCAASLACLAAKQFRLWRKAKLATAMRGGGAVNPGGQRLS